MPRKTARFIWTDTTGTGRNRWADWMDFSLRLYLGVWDNPHPEKKVATLDFESADTDSGVFCVAISVEKPGRN